MRIGLRLAVLGAALLAPAAALAQWWAPWSPDLSEDQARLIATQYGIVDIQHIYPTIDSDWRVKGPDGFGHWVEVVIDGTTGELERAEMRRR